MHPDNGIGGLPFELQVHIAAHARSLPLRCVNKTLRAVVDECLKNLNVEISDRIDFPIFYEQPIVALNSLLGEIVRRIEPKKTLKRIVEENKITLSSTFLEYSKFCSLLEKIRKEHAFEVMVRLTFKQMYNINNETTMTTSLEEMWPQLQSDVEQVKTLSIDMINKTNPLPLSTPYYVPEQIGQFRFLNMLLLNFTGIRELPSTFGQLHFLKNLDLSSNRIIEFPPEIFHLKALESLSLRHNKIEDIPSKIGDISTLVSLNLGNNQLRGLPREVSKLTALETLFINSNKNFEHLADYQIDFLANLKELFIDPSQQVTLFYAKKRFRQEFTLRVLA